jgi:hypothetical protein
MEAQPDYNTWGLSETRQTYTDRLFAILPATFFQFRWENIFS